MQKKVSFYTAYFLTPVSFSLTVVVGATETPGDQDGGCQLLGSHDRETPIEKFSSSMISIAPAPGVVVVGTVPGVDEPKCNEGVIGCKVARRVHPDVIGPRHIEGIND